MNCTEYKNNQNSESPTSTSNTPPKLNSVGNARGFYWFNIDLANNITNEGRNMTHMMEDHLSKYWKTTR